MHDTQSTAAFRIIVLVTRAAYQDRLAELLAISDDKDTTPNEIDPTHQGILVELETEIHARVHLFTEPDQTLVAIQQHPIDSIIIDNREGEQAHADFSATLAGRLLPELLSNTLASRPLSRRLILVLLPESKFTPYHAYAIGSLQLGGVLINPSSLAAALTSACRAAKPRVAPKVAICLAGGGIEGMFFELGVLRAIDAHLDGHSVTDFDVFSGISAGAVLCAFMANGIRPQELSEALHGRPSSIGIVTRGMLFDPNMQELASRALESVGDIVRGRWFSRPLDTALKVAPTALFSGEKLRRYLEREFNKPGLTDEFSSLRKELFVGVTDQDTGTHVTFGEQLNEGIPISQAVRASMAMTPYYPPEKINGRYYVDGIFTRNVDLDVAVAHGARLIICIDPLTPVQVDQPGYVSGRGGLFTTVQSVKSLIRTRLSAAIDRAEETYPDVTICVFSPTPRDMELMSGTMMRFFYRIETEDMAFESTSQRFVREFDWLARDFARHGIKIKR